MDNNLKYLIAVEELAQDILTVKETKLELANAQNKLREALRGLQKTEDRMSFLVVGDLHIYKRTKECKGIIEEGKHNVIKNKLCLNGLYHSLPLFEPWSILHTSQLVNSILLDAVCF